MTLVVFSLFIISTNLTNQERKSLVQTNVIDFKIQSDMKKEPSIRTHKFNVFFKSSRKYNKPSRKFFRKTGILLNTPSLLKSY